VRIQNIVLSHKSPSETLQMLEEAYGKSTIKKTQVWEWHILVRFRDGHETDSLFCRPTVPANRSLVVKEYVSKSNVTTLEHPPYSPDLSPPDFFLIPLLKTVLKEQ
jgi:hypothetical protein